MMNYDATLQTLARQNNNLQTKLDRIINMYNTLEAKCDWLENENVRLELENGALRSVSTEALEEQLSDQKEETDYWWHKYNDLRNSVKTLIDKYEGHNYTDCDDCK